MDARYRSFHVSARGVEMSSGFWENAISIGSYMVKLFLSMASKGEIYRFSKH
jgi:hypothetical protein